MWGRRWTAAEEVFLIRHRRTWHPRAIARHLGRSERAVISYSYAHRCHPWQGSWYTPIDVARLCGVTRQCVTGWCRDSKIRCRRVPGMRRWLIDPADVERLVAERNPLLWRRWETTRKEAA